MKEYLTIDDLSQILSIKRATLYSKVSHGEIPHYKIGHLIRFKKSDIDSWLENLRQDSLNAKEKASEIVNNLKPKTLSVPDIKHIVRKAIDSEKGQGYNSGNGKSGQSLGEEV